MLEAARGRHSFSSEAGLRGEMLADSTCPRARDTPSFWFLVDTLSRILFPSRYSFPDFSLLPNFSSRILRHYFDEYFLRARLTSAIDMVMSPPQKIYQPIMSLLFSSLFRPRLEGLAPRGSTSPCPTSCRPRQHASRFRNEHGSQCVLPGLCL